MLETIPQTRSSLLLLLSFLLVFFVSPLGAQGIFSAQEVDQPARPTGGQPMFLDFIRHNVRVPFANLLEEVSGKVGIRGIIEPDGTMASIEVVNGLNPASNNEVKRIFSLYKAWEPAQKDGRKVRQYFQYTLQFPPQELRGLDRQNRVIDYYFSKAAKRIDSEADADFHIQVNMDENGLPTDLVKVRSKSRKKWSEFEEMRNEPVELPRDRVAQILGVEESDLALYLDGSEGYLIKIHVDPFDLELPDYIVTKERRMVMESLPGSYSKIYYASGQTAEVRMYEGEAITQNLSWYPNSIVKEKYYSEFQSDGTRADKVIALYDQTGKPLVLNGQGELTETGFRWGTGRFEDGFLTGTWKILTPGGEICEEVYEKSRLINGKRIRLNGQEVTYEKIRVSPTFEGGDSSLYKFLAQMIRYPSEASRARVQGRVVISFIVNPDGTIQDLKVEKSVSPDLDREALRVLGFTSGKWVPGTERGVPTAMRYTIPVNFTLH